MRRLRLIYQRRQTYVRYALWMCLLAIVVLSLVPGEARPHTGAPGEVEHFIAYLGTGVFIAVRYRSPRTRAAFWAATVLLSFTLEFLQQFTPGREPDIFDALASSAGLSLGVLLGAALVAAAHSFRAGLHQNDVSNLPIEQFPLWIDGKGSSDVG